MQVVGVKGVVVGRQGCAEDAAGPVADLMQEASRGRVGVPVTRHGDLPTVAQLKARHVDSRRPRVRARTPADLIVDVAASLDA